MNDDTVDEEGLRLLKAFYSVRDPSARKAIVTLAEAAVQGAKITTRTVDNRKSATDDLRLIWSRPRGDA